jgi:transcription antitermination factor NusG
MSGALYAYKPMAQPSRAAKLLQPRLNSEAWYALQTRFRFEKKVAAQLSGKVEVFLPLRRENRAWSDRNKVVLVPLFPGYVFVHSVPSLRLRLLVLQTAGVMGFVGLAGTAAVVPSKQIEDLRLLLAEGAAFSLHPFVYARERVRIRGGRLDGLEGMLTQGETGKLVISIESIQRSVAIEIQGHEVEAI